MIPLDVVHCYFCNYGNSLFFFVPGDSGDPFVALWQAALVEGALLLVVGGIFLALSRHFQRVGFRMFGIGYLGAMLWCGGLALATKLLTQPLICDAPGSSQPTTTQERASQTFATLQAIGILTLYGTALLLAVAIIAVLVVVVRGSRSLTRQPAHPRS